METPRYRSLHAVGAAETRRDPDVTNAAPSRRRCPYAGPMAELPRHHRPALPGAAPVRRAGRRRRPGGAQRGRRPVRHPAGPRSARPGRRRHHRARRAARGDRGPRPDRRAVVRRAGRLAGRVPVAPLPAADLGVRRPGVRGPRVRPGPAALPGARGGRRRLGPPGPADVQSLVDTVLRGIRVGDFADTLFRAAAFARVTAAGRAHHDHGRRLVVPQRRRRRPG